MTIDDMKDEWTTYDVRDGRVVKEPPVIIIRKGKRKVNPLFERLLKEVPQDIKDRVDKMLTCAYLVNGNECSKDQSIAPCNPDECTAWKHYKQNQ